MNYEDVKAKLLSMRDYGLNETVIYFALLQFKGGVRISDLLRIKRTNVLNNLTVYIEQCKGSEPLFIDVSSEQKFWLAYKNGSFTDISDFNYKYFYRLYDKIGLNVINGPDKNRSVTHAGRKLKAQNYFDETENIELVQHALGHKSKKSKMYYLNGKQKKMVVKGGINGNIKGSDRQIKAQNRFGKTIIYLTK